MSRKIFTGARIFDGERFHDERALIVKDGRVEAIVGLNALPLKSTSGLQERLHCANTHP